MWRLWHKEKVELELVELGSILKMVKGKKPVNHIAEPRDGYLPYVNIDAFENGVIKQYTDDTKCTPCDDGDILIVCDGSRSGLVGKAVKGYVGSTLAKISASGLRSDYLFYFVQGKYALLNTQKKGTGTPHLNPELLKQQKLIVPAPYEQARIVARIEELFSQLDAGVETLKKTKAQLAVYRQAVLKEAFANNDASEVLAEDTVSRQRHSFSIGPFGSNLKVSDYTDSGVPLVFVRDIRNGFASNNHKFVSLEKAEQLKAHQVHQGDLLITKMGDPPGDCCIYPFDHSAIITADCIKMEIDQTVIVPLFAMYFIQSCYGKEQIKAITQGVAQKKVSLARFKKFKFMIPTLHEQRRIVFEIESRLSVCDSIEQTVDVAMQQADAMRQSILKDAFEGRL